MKLRPDKIIRYGIEQAILALALCIILIQGFEMKPVSWVWIILGVALLNTVIGVKARLEIMDKDDES